MKTPIYIGTWGPAQLFVLYKQNSRFQELIFIYLLPLLVQVSQSDSIKFVFQSEALTKRLLYSIDNAVRIESFAGSSKETNPVYKDYQGLFHLTKLTSVHSITPFVPPSLDLAFKLRRKKFNIEKLHLPPGILMQIN